MPLSHFVASVSGYRLLPFRSNSQLSAFTLVVRRPIDRRAAAGGARADGPVAA
eukprot:COSAG02_NODE_51025_length_317_cov_0.463303_1_plen_52_part_01